MEILRKASNEAQLCNLGYRCNVFAWNNRIKAQLIIMKRLDGFMGNLSFSSLFHNASVNHLDWYSSGHRHICIHFSITCLASHGVLKKNNFQILRDVDPGCCLQGNNESVLESWTLFLSYGIYGKSNFDRAISSCWTQLSRWGRYKKRIMHFEIGHQRALRHATYGKSAVPSFSGNIRHWEKIG